VEIETLLEVSSKDPYLQLKGLSWRSCSQEQDRGDVTRGHFQRRHGPTKILGGQRRFSLLLIGLFVLNRLGFVYIASSFAVVLTGVGSFFLIDENLRATFVTMPILIASSLLVPWAEFVIVLIDAAAILGIGSIFADTPDRDHHLLPVCRQPRARLS
jgi:hypothetical protein